MYQATYVPTEAQITTLARALERSRAIPGLESGQPTHIQRFAVRTLQILVAGLAVAVLVVTVTSGASIKAWQVLLVALLAYLSGAMAVVLHRERGLRPLLSALIATSHPITFNLTPEGVTVAVNMTNSFTPWEAIQTVLLTDNFVLLLREDSIMYVPASAFVDEQAMLTFTSYASSRVVSGA